MSQWPLLITPCCFDQAQPRFTYDDEEDPERAFFVGYYCVECYQPCEPLTTVEAVKNLHTRLQALEGKL